MRIIKPKKDAAKQGDVAGELFSYETIGEERLSEQSKPIDAPEVAGSLLVHRASAGVSSHHSSELALAKELYGSCLNSRKAESSGKEIDEEGQSIAVALRKKEFNKLLDKGMYLLSMREHSCKELHTKLCKKSEHLDLVDSVIETLLEAKYLSDERFTESYVRQRRNKGFGPVKIRAELINKGIKNNAIECFLETGSAQWFDLAEQQYLRKFSGKGKMTEYKEWTKRARFLQSRGFTMDHIHSVIPPFESD